MSELRYNNPYCRRVRGSFLLLVSCGHCQTAIATYQKIGKGGLLRMYIERIINSSIDLSKLPNALHCPNCKAHLASKATVKGNDAYVMQRSVFHTSELDS